MGLVPDTLDAVFDEAEASKGTGVGGLLPAGEYEGVVVSAEVRPSPVKTWVTAELSLKLQVVDGPHKDEVTFCDIELAPNTTKDGQPSKGKLGFVKGQLEGLGYTGKLSQLEYSVNTFLGAKVAFKQKVDTHIDENGAVDQYGRINPNTGTPYVDREVYLNELLAAGPMAQSAPMSAATAPTVY